MSIFAERAQESMNTESVLNNGDDDVFPCQAGKMVISGSAKGETSAMNPDKNRQGRFVCENRTVNIYKGLKISNCYIFKIKFLKF